MLSQAGIPILQIDAFADEPFTGNPAAVCLPDVEPPAGWMQQIAAEMNLSETAFAWPSGDGYGLRWFTPVAEVDLCGHATLATAFALWETGRVDCDDDISFTTRSGVLEVRREQDIIKNEFSRRTSNELRVAQRLGQGAWRGDSVVRPKPDGPSREGRL